MKRKLLKIGDLAVVIRNTGHERYNKYIGFVGTVTETGCTSLEDNYAPSNNNNYRLNSMHSPLFGYEEVQKIDPSQEYKTFYQFLPKEID